MIRIVLVNGVIIELPVPPGADFGVIVQRVRGDGYLLVPAGYVPHDQISAMTMALPPGGGGIQPLDHTSGAMN